jgi:hypothetical protein
MRCGATTEPLRHHLPYYGWSYDLVDAARYYALFDGLIALWRDLFPGRVLELGYER